MAHRFEIFLKGIFVVNLSECNIPEEVTKLLKAAAFPYPEMIVGQVMQTISGRFDDIFFKILQEQEEAITCEGSEIDFVTFVVPFCLEMCREATYQSFLLVCAFLREVIFQSFMSQCCYRVLYLSSKCLMYVYGKRFRKLLPPEEGLDELISFCRLLQNIEENMEEIMKDILPFTVELLEKCTAGENRFVLHGDDIQTIFGEISWMGEENSPGEDLEGAVGPNVAPGRAIHSLPRVCETRNVNLQNSSATSEAMDCVSDSISPNVETDMESCDRDWQNSPGTNKCLPEDYQNLPGPSRSSAQDYQNLPGPSGSSDQNYQNLPRPSRASDQNLPGPSKSSFRLQGTFGSITNIFLESEARKAYNYFKLRKGHYICGFCDTNCFTFLNIVDQFKNCY